VLVVDMTVFLFVFKRERKKKIDIKSSSNMIKLRRLNQYWRSFYMQYNTTRCIDGNQDNKTLKDMTKSGEQRPWREKENR
jgi:secreted Zn-dependent insulinase-like peptidase